MEGTGDTEIELRIDCSECKLYQHSRKFFNHDIAVKTRTRIFNALVRSRLTYSCQTWPLTRKQQQQINSSYMGMLRQMMRNGYRRKERPLIFVLSNEDQLRIWGTSSIEDYIAWQQKTYLAHVIRTDDASIAKRLLFNANPSKRPGRQITLLSMVLNRELCTEDAFGRDAIRQKF